jgi:predicted membrane metal-binding protein
LATVLESAQQHGPLRESSDRGFGFVFAGVFALVGCWPLLHWQQPRLWALGLAAAFALIAVVRPALLHPLNLVWLALGRLLHRVVSPLIMGMIFFLCVTPTGWIMRLMGKDVLSLKRRGDLASYWITREPSAAKADAMTKQF